jgi:branched-chain amino acid transport system ATP-binding protein
MLAVTDARKEFGGLVAVDDVSFEIGEAEIVGLIGPNGAGKTTLFDTIAGVFRGDGETSIEFDGTEIAAREPHEVAREGLVRTFQIVRTFDGMTVLENVLAGATFGGHGTPDPEAAEAGAREALAFVGLEAAADERAGSLTIAERKRLELARALATDPRLVMLDEIASGLTPGELDELTGVIRRIRDERGVSVLWIEHVTDAIMGTVERVLVLNSGRLIADGPPEEIRRNQRVVDAYLGESA